MSILDRFRAQPKQVNQTQINTVASALKVRPPVPIEELPELNPILSARVNTTLLKPHRVSVPIATSRSKMGGKPNTSLLTSWPQCDECGAYLNFVMQLYREDYPEFYFPGESNFFMLFRCPNNQCPAAYKTHKFDKKVFWLYGNIRDRNKTNTIARPKVVAEYYDQHVNECEFQSVSLADYPSYADHHPELKLDLQNKYHHTVIEEIGHKYGPAVGSKIGGYPSWIQQSYYPQNRVGQPKQFFFQLASEDLETGVAHPPPVDKWSGHGVMIGDVGNLYFFVDPSSGTDSIETYWDCF
jgi:hypothetical protein